MNGIGKTKLNGMCNIQMTRRTSHTTDTGRMAMDWLSFGIPPSSSVLSVSYSGFSCQTLLVKSDVGLLFAALSLF